VQDILTVPLLQRFTAAQTLELMAVGAKRQRPAGVRLKNIGEGPALPLHGRIEPIGLAL
jgi:hypothetical protein